MGSEVMVRSVAWAIAMMALACAGGTAETQKRDNLEDTVLYFHTHLKGGDFERAAAYVAAEAAEAFQALHDPSRNVYRIQDFNVSSYIPEANGSRSVVLVVADVTRNNSTTVRQVRYREVWRDSGSGRWRLISEELLVPRGGEGR